MVCIAMEEEFEENNTFWKDTKNEIETSNQIFAALLMRK